MRGVPAPALCCGRWWAGFGVPWGASDKVRGAEEQSLRQKTALRSSKVSCDGLAAFLPAPFVRGLDSMSALRAIKTAPALPPPAPAPPPSSSAPLVGVALRTLAPRVATASSGEATWLSLRLRTTPPSPPRGHSPTVRSMGPSEGIEQEGPPGKGFDLVGSSVEVLSRRLSPSSDPTTVVESREPSPDERITLLDERRRVAMEASLRSALPCRDFQ